MFSPCLCRFFPVTLASPDIPKTCKLIGDSILLIGVNVSVNGCLSLYVSPAVNWQLVQDVPHPRPVLAGIGFSPPRPCKRISSHEND